MLVLISVEFNDFKETDMSRTSARHLFRHSSTNTDDIKHVFSKNLNDPGSKPSPTQ